MDMDYLAYSQGKVSATGRLYHRIELRNRIAWRQKEVEEHREIQQKLADMRPAPSGVKVRKLVIGGVPCERITPEQGRTDRVILHIHGGSWAFGSLLITRPVAALLATLTGCTVVVVDYRLAPEFPFPAGLEDCHKVYAGLLERGVLPEQIALFGDSAGGNLSLCLLHLLKSGGEPLPAAVACASPVTDMTENSAISREKPDVLFTLHQGVERDIFSLYTAGHPTTDPLLSPRLGDLRGFPPILIHVGEEESLCADNIDFAKAASQAGVEVLCKVWREMFHDFTIVGITLKESRQSLEEMALMLTKHLRAEKIPGSREPGTGLRTRLNSPKLLPENRRWRSSHPSP